MELERAKANTSSLLELEQFEAFSDGGLTDQPEDRLVHSRSEVEMLFKAALNSHIQ